MRRWLAALRSARVLCAGRTRCTYCTRCTHRTRFHAHPARRLFPLRRTGRGSAEARCGDRQRARGRATATQLIDPTNLGKYVLRGRRSRVEARALLARVCVDLRRMGDDSRISREATARFTSRCGFPGRARPCVSPSRNATLQNVFVPLWQVDVDPHSASGRTSVDGPGRTPSALFVSGPASRKVDLLLVSDGYSLAQEAKFRADATRLVNALFAHEPFKSRRADFNVRTLLTGSAGAAALVEFNIFGLERYALTYDNRRLRNAAAAAPYDIVEVLMNEAKYGGGGIFNQQSTVAAGNESAEYVFIHELAHNLAGLGDEYVGTVTYETGAPQKVEPWEPNITALHDPSALEVARSRRAGYAGADADVVCGQGRRVRRRGIRSRAASTGRRPRASWDRGRPTHSAASASARLIASSICTPTDARLLVSQRKDAGTQRFFLKRILCAFASLR